MRVQITHLKAPWPSGAVVGDVLDLPAVPVWAVGKCKQVDDDAELTIGQPTIESMCAEILAKVEDLGEAPQVATGEGDGAGQPLPVIEEAPVKAKKK